MSHCGLQSSAWGDTEELPSKVFNHSQVKNLELQSLHHHPKHPLQERDSQMFSYLSPGQRSKQRFWSLFCCLHLIQVGLVSRCDFGGTQKNVFDVCKLYHHYLGRLGRPVCDFCLQTTVCEAGELVGQVSRTLLSLSKMGNYPLLKAPRQWPPSATMTRCWRSTPDHI